MKPRYPHQTKHPATAGKRPSRSKVQDELGSINELNVKLNEALRRMGIRTDGQLMRANYQAGVGRRSVKGRPPEDERDIV